MDSSVDYVREQEHSLSRLTRKNQDSVVGCRCLLLVFCLFFSLVVGVGCQQRAEEEEKNTSSLFSSSCGIHEHIYM